MKRRWLAVMLAVCMVLGLLPGTAGAVEDEPGGGITPQDGNALTYGSLTYKIVDGEIAITGCDKAVTSVSIPAQIDGMPVTSIENVTFYGCSKLTHLTIPGSVTTMGSQVFGNNYGLKTAGPIGGGYNYEFGWTDEIPGNAFSWCESLTDITFPAGITAIGEQAFSTCGFSSITIPDTVTSIGRYAFTYCRNLEKVIIPSSVTEIGGGVFGSCNKLTSAGPIGGGYSIEFGWTEEIPAMALSGCDYLERIVFPAGITTIGDYAFDGCRRLVCNKLPDSVTGIGQCAFRQCEVLTSSIVISDHIRLGGGAFGYCNSLESVILPSTEIPSAFVGCPNLVSAGPLGGDYNIQFPAAEEINLSFFAGLDIQQLVIPDGTTTLNAGSWWSPCNRLTHVIIPESVVYVGTDAYFWSQNGISGWFKHPGLTSAGPIGGDYNIQFGWTEVIPECAFADTYITRAVLPDGITHIGAYAFAGCKNLSEVSLPSSVTAIENGTFAECSSLSRMVLPDKIASIGWSAFRDCTNLKYVTISGGIQSIGSGAFRNCTSLTDIYYTGSQSDWEKIRISESDNDSLLNATIHYNSTGMGGAGEGPDKPDVPDTPEDPNKYKVYCNGGYEGFGVSIEQCMAKTPSTKYNPQLAHMLIAMCNSVHSIEDMRRTFESFEFSGIEISHVIAPGKIMVGYGMAKKTIGNLGNQKTLVLIVGRGTTDLLEWASNLDASANAQHEHSGFSDAGNALYNRVVSLLGTNDFSNVEFVITGHSRGAAAANILAKRLVDETGQMNHIYTYTFACPDTAVITSGTASRYENIFNINNINDPISWIPGSIWRESGEKDGHGANTYWNKYGKSYWYCSADTWEDHRIILDKPSSIFELLGMMDRFGMIHPQNFYMDYLRKEYALPSRAYKNRTEAVEIINISKEKRRQGVRAENIKNIYGVLTPESVTMLPEVTVFCPVDVEIYSSTGDLVGKITDNTASSVNTEKVYISVSEDDKYIYPLDDGVYTLKLIGTEDGAMTYSVQNIDIATGTAVGEQTFEQVVLTSGKQFASEVTVDQNIVTEVMTQDVKLYVTDNAGEPEKEVLPDGSGTEIPVVKPEEPDGPDVPDVSVLPDTPTYPTYPTYPGVPSGPPVSKPAPSEPEMPAQPSEPETPAEPSGPARPGPLPFTDVPAGAYYYDAVRWAVERGVTTGTTATTFSPDQPCTRAQAVTFLWLAAGSPAPQGGQPFTDVRPGAYYYDAVRWAAERGITTGATASTFGPDETVTRGQAAALLYRAAGSPSPAGDSPFADVDSGAYYASAVRWAAAEKITSGTSATSFSPDAPCTRAQMITFLYRAQ